VPRGVNTQEPACAGELQGEVVDFLKETVRKTREPPTGNGAIKPVYFAWEHKYVTFLLGIGKN
jgi:hypothetical protein